MYTATVSYSTQGKTTFQKPTVKECNESVNTFVKGIGIKTYKYVLSDANGVIEDWNFEDGKIKGVVTSRNN